MDNIKVQHYIQIAGDSPITKCKGCTKNEGTTSQSCSKIFQPKELRSIPVKRTQNNSKITNYITDIQDRLMLSPNTIATKIAKTPTKNKPEWNPEVDLTD